MCETLTYRLIVIVYVVYFVFYNCMIKNKNYEDVMLFFSLGMAISSIPDLMFPKHPFYIFQMIEGYIMGMYMLY